MEITAAYQQGWTKLQKIAFRFFACLFLLYLFPFSFYSFPFINEIQTIHPKLEEWYGVLVKLYVNFWHSFISWIGKNIVGLKSPITTFGSGSGDTTFNYVLLHTQFSLATLGCVLWTLLDRKRKSYNQAYYWLRVLLRYCLATAMFGYGFAKIFHLQMPFPNLSHLVRPLGDKSPMGLAWSFIGYSKGYSAYTGWAEVIGGLLLFFRRTTLLGALAVMVVMMNVAAINFFYDVPVKLNSSMFILMAVFLIAKDFKRLLNVLILHKPSTAANFPRMILSRRWWIASRVFKWLFIASALYGNISGSVDALKMYGDNRKLPPLYGIYNTEILIKNSDTLAPLTTDSTRWKQLIIEYEKYAQVKMMNDSMHHYNFEVNDTLKKIVFSSWNDYGSTLHYELDSTALILRGKFGKDSMYMRLRKYDIKKFRLVNRGFRWINEYPYNW